MACQDAPARAFLSALQAADWADGLSALDDALGARQQEQQQRRDSSAAAVNAAVDKQAARQAALLVNRGFCLHKQALPRKALKVCACVHGRTSRFVPWQHGHAACMCMHGAACSG